MRQLKITKQITQRSEESINRYFQEISKYSIITAEDEVDLTVRIRAGDAVALEKLVVANLRFVVSVAKQYQNQGLSFSDLINEGNVGLVKAAKKFDETRGFKFISYAVWWIRQSIIQAISEQTRIVRLPLNKLSSINKIRRAIPFLEQEFEREPNDDELAEYLDLPNEEVTQANSIKNKQISFDKPLSSNEESDFSLYDIIQTGNVPSPDNEALEESLVTNIKRALSKLSTRESSVLIKSFGLFNTPIYSLQDIADEYNMSSERIRQIKTRGLEKLKSIMKGNYSLLEFL
ncbi:MAG: sigma-70 family RNA polymerase sigma factor [Bacteroidales bacterium]|nr:sigma-70 family RNA polymerase sigma factor [Bacteroidales bacterium]